MALTDWGNNASILEIGRIVPDVRTKTNSGLSLLPCDNSRYKLLDYPILAASIDSQHVENAIELTKLEHQDIENYHNGNACVVETNGVLHVIVSDNAQSGIISSTDGGSSFSEFSPFSSLLSLSPSGYGTIRASSSGETLVMCHNRNVYISNNRGQTWYKRSQSVAGTYFQYYDVSPNGQKIICITNVFSGNNRDWASSSDGGQTWVVDTYNAKEAERHFQFVSDSTIVFVNASEHNVYYSSFRSPTKSIALSSPGGTSKSIIAKKGTAIALYGAYGGTHHDDERLYLTDYGWNYTRLPYRYDIQGNVQGFGELHDFTVLDNGDLYVYASEGLLMLKNGSNNWVNVYTPEMPAGMPNSAFLNSSNNDVFIVARDAFYKTQGALSPYFFFTPNLSDDGIYKLVGDAQ
ncbi:exo-alpha-sialidase [Pseudoalteromonas sp. GCY]|uniref:sialidase family protein n=1 Tax=Pseudoalteromonas sp. GCY TaxID=2003316 RepID=UPI000BFECD07|nr:sialidase family protein [Pseudoalteromonas sp. GCY]QQQ68164.1 exo-alpha-sialidase [Pseudoalteromonas sp. GCY]